MKIASVACLAFLVITVSAQAPPKVAPAIDPNKIAGLLETGHCPEALPQAMKAYKRASAPDLKRRIGSASVHCATALNKTEESVQKVVMGGAGRRGTPPQR